jgi:formylglycine-generating enzyme required for sulfatase activity
VKPQGLSPARLYLNSMPEVKKSGLTFRLPTEKEWEYACRAGSTGDYCKLADGTEITKGTLGDVAWYENNSGSKTHTVGQKKPNAFGLYDMHGNVWEWCEDLFQAGDSRRVYRGGGWGSSSRYCAAGNRFISYPDNRYDILGFRLAASQDVNR